MVTKPTTSRVTRPTTSAVTGVGVSGVYVPDFEFDYLIESNEDFTSVLANSTATLSGKTAAVKPGTYTWPEASLSARAFTSTFVIRSWNPNNKAIMNLAGGSHGYGAPTNTQWRDMAFYAPFIPGTDDNSGPACKLTSTVSGLEFLSCEIYGNLRDLVVANGWPDQMGDWGWRGFFGFDGTTNIGTNGLKFTNCEIHSGRRLLNLTGGTGPLEIVGNEFYDFGVDALVIAGAQTNLKLNWNKFHSPLSGWNGNDIAGTFDPATDRFTSTAPHGLTGTPTLNISPNTGTVPGGLSLLDDYQTTVIDANVIQFPTDVTSAGVDVRVYREPSHADFMQAIPNGESWNGFEVIGNRFTSERYDDLDSFRDAQVIFFEDINAADDDADHYEDGSVLFNMIWSENTTHGISIYNPINCSIRNNTLVGLEDVAGGLPVGFRRHFASGTGSGNVATNNVCIAKPVSDFTGDRLEGNFLAGYNQTPHSEVFVGPDTPPTTVDQLVSRFSIATTSIPYLMEPRCGAGGTGYVDYDARTYSLPTLPPFDLTHVSEIIGATTASFIVSTTRGAGTLYWMVSTEARTAAQVIAQGTATAKGTQAVSGTGNQSSISITGLTAETEYYLYAVQVDGADQSQMIVTALTTIESAGFTIVDNQGNAYLTRTGGWAAGPTSGKQITFAMRGQLNAGDGAVRAVVRQGTSSQRLQIDLQSTNKFRLQVRNSAGTVIGRVDSSADFNVAAGPFWVVASLDLANGIGLVYVNGVSGKSGTDILTDDNIQFDNTGTLSLLASPTGTGPTDINIEYLYISQAFVDLTNATNLNKFQTLTGMTSNGSGPTGATPVLFMTGSAATWNAGTNQGFGGDFAATNTFV